MNNNKLPYSLNNMASLSRYSDIICNMYEELPPIYLSVRREVFLNVGIGNPLDPLDFESITKDIIVGYNNVEPVCTKIIPTSITHPLKIYPCENITEGVSAFSSLIACRVLSTEIFSVVVYSPNLNQFFNIRDVHAVVDQIVDYFSPDSILPNEKDFTIDIKFKNGTYEDLNYTGYTSLQFVLDNPDEDPNGPGTYFFTVVPEIRPKFINIP